MGNMSYCRFENTLRDFKDCYEAMGMISDLDELSKSEKRAALKLIKEARDFADDYEDLLEE